MNLPPEGVVGKSCKNAAILSCKMDTVGRGEKHFTEIFEAVTLDHSCKRNMIDARNRLETDCSVKLVMISISVEWAFLMRLVI